MLNGIRTVLLRIGEWGRMLSLFATAMTLALGLCGCTDVPEYPDNCRGEYFFGGPCVYYTLTVSRNPASGGTTNTSGLYDVAAGTQVNISATVATGYTFTNWTISGSGTIANSSNASTSVTVNGDVTVTANFTQNPATTYSLTVNSNPVGGGTVTPAGENKNVNVGQQVNISATAANGYTFSNWTISGSGTFGDANSASTYVTVNGDVTVTANFEQIVVVTPGVDEFADSRDGKVYKKVTIGGQTWMAENLNYKPSSGNSWCYENEDSYCSQYGRLYDWSAAMNVCPSGWHLPSREEWVTLAKYAGGTGTYGDGGTAGKKLKAEDGWNSYTSGGVTYSGNGTDDYGFSALPGGLRNSDGSFVNAGYYGYWWTATGISGGSAYHSMGCNYDNVYESYDFKWYGYSVRCVGD